jgi:hypothetical protein
MRLIKALLVAAAVATTSLAAAGTAHAETLSSLGFLGETGSDVFYTDGTNVRVSYMCTSRVRTGLIQVLNQDSEFRRTASTRCDGVPRSVLLRTDPGRNAIFMRQETAARARFAVFGKPCQTAACFG